MLDHPDYGPEDCQALSDVLARVGDRWTILTVGMLAGGPRRFNEMRRAIDGITQRMLTLTLRALERDGLVIRTPYPTLPISVEYALSARGSSLLIPLIALAEWAREHRHGIEHSRRD
jgi:DNA-binding HxlR family transcriptional regulator